MSVMKMDETFGEGFAIDPVENMSTNEQSETQNISQNGNDKSETCNHLENNGPNSVESEFSSNSEGKKESFNGDESINNEVTSERREDSLENNKNGDSNNSNKTLPSDNGNSVLTQVSDLQTSEQAEESSDQGIELDNGAMSRQNMKSRLPNKTASRSALTHSKIPGELSGQPTAKNTNDIKYWKNREQELLNKIAELEGREAEKGCKVQGPSDPVTTQTKEIENDSVTMSKDKENHKNRVQTSEKEIYNKQKELSAESNLKNVKSPEEVINHLKLQNEDLRNALTKMTSILRDKTTMCISQEKKIAALVNQVESLKEVVAITKDLLNIRNMEVQHLSNDISAMESKIDCERQRHNQMLSKMDEAVKLNTELKKEYENQLKLFQHLRDSYEEKILLLSRDKNNEKKENQSTEKTNTNDDSSYSQVQTLTLK